MLTLTIIRYMIAVGLAYIGYLLFKNLFKNKIRKGDRVMIADTGFEGNVVEVVKYEDMTLYGVRMGNEIQHYERDRIIKRT